IWVGRKTRASSANGRVCRPQARGSLPPDRLLGPAELCKFGVAQRRLAEAEEFVELRRRHAGAAQHRMDLATMMDVVLEQVQQQPVGALLLDAGVAMDADDAVGIALSHCF